MTDEWLDKAMAEVRSDLPEFRQQDDYLLAHGASLMSDDSHEIIHVDTLRKIVAAALRAAGDGAEPDDALPAPSNSLPSWDECAQRVRNSDFIAKRVADGGYGAEPDSLLASELHRFIYEYDDADRYRSAWFLHRLELLLNETQRTNLATPPDREALLLAKDAERYRRLRGGNDYEREEPMVLLYEKDSDNESRPYWSLAGEVLDDAIDAAIAAQEGKS